MSEQNEPIEHRIVLEELRRNLDKSYEASDALDTKLQQLLGFTSLIIAISGTLQLSALRQAGGLIFGIALLCAIALYALVFLVIFRALKPTTRDWVITGDWSALNELYFNSGETKVIERLVYDYLESIKQNDKVNARKAGALRAAMIIVFLLVITVLIAMPISLAVTPLASPFPTP